MNSSFKHFIEKSQQTEETIEVAVAEIEHNQKLKSFINRYIYFVGGFGVAVIIPQVTNVWIEQNVDGVSLTTWAGFFIASFFWLLYGMVHKERPIIYTNSLVCLLDFLIIVGILIHRI